MVNFKKVLLCQQILSVILVANLFDHAHNFTAQAYWTNIMNPGMKIRLEQKDLDGFKKSMSKFLPEVINTGLFPQEYAYAIGMPWLDFLKYHFVWNNITYSTDNLHLKDVDLLIVRKEDVPFIKVSFPAFEKWSLKANQTVDTWIPGWMDGAVELVLDKFEFHFNTKLALDEHGYLNLLIDNVYIDFGESMLYHEDEVLQFFMY